MAIKPSAELQHRIANNRVPEALHAKLEDARLRFHKARLDLEHAMASTEFEYQERVNAHEDAMHRVEQELESLSAEVQAILDRPM